MEVIVFYQNQDALLYEDYHSLEYENVVKMHDGSLRDFQVIKKVFKSSEDECLGYIGILSDITEYKEKEKKLQELASIDPLTKLYNRRHFSKVANQLVHLKNKLK